MARKKKGFNPRGADPTGVHLRQKAFLAAFAETGVIRKAALAAGINRRQHFKWMEQPAYAEAFKDALEDATDRVEEEARRRAVEGIKEPVYYQGEVVGHTLKYSDNLLEKLLKAYRGERFKDRHEVTGAEGKPLLTMVNLSNLSDEELENLEQLSQKLVEDSKP